MRSGRGAILMGRGERAERRGHGAGKADGPKGLE